MTAVERSQNEIMEKAQRHSDADHALSRVPGGVAFLITGGSVLEPSRRLDKAALAMRLTGPFYPCGIHDLARSRAPWHRQRSAARSHREIFTCSRWRLRCESAQGPIVISSGYRSPALNEAVGGAANSAHVLASRPTSRARIRPSAVGLPGNCPMPNLRYDHRSFTNTARRPVVMVSFKHRPARADADADHQPQRHEKKGLQTMKRRRNSKTYWFAGS